MRSALSMRSALLGAARMQRAMPAGRFYSAAASQLRPLDASKLSITKTQSPKTLSRPEDLIFGNKFTGTYAAAFGEDVYRSAGSCS